jgi:hypothetical protein
MRRKKPAPDAEQEVWDKYNVERKELHQLRTMQWRLNYPERAKTTSREGSVKFRYRHPEKARTAAREGTRKKRAEDPVAARVKGALWNKQWRERHPEEHKMIGLKNLYGISREDYSALILVQNKCCAICRLELKLSIDHCHRTNRVRGLLCKNCNTALGMLKDSPQLLRAAADYLEKWAK